MTETQIIKENSVVWRMNFTHIQPPPSRFDRIYYSPKLQK